MKALNEEMMVNEDINYNQVYGKVAVETENFTKEEGFLECEDYFEKDVAKGIFKKYYENVEEEKVVFDGDTDKSYYIVHYSGLLGEIEPEEEMEIETESLNESLTKSYDPDLPTTEQLFDSYVNQLKKIDINTIDGYNKAKDLENEFNEVLKLADTIRIKNAEGGTSEQQANAFAEHLYSSKGVGWSEVKIKRYPSWYTVECSNREFFKYMLQVHFDDDGYSRIVFYDFTSDRYESLQELVDMYDKYIKGDLIR